MFRRAAILFLCGACAVGGAFGQGAVNLPRLEERDRAQKQAARQQERVAQAANLEIVGNGAFSDEELRTHLREQITAIEQYGLTAARADDAAFFLELFYRQRGYANVNVSYALPGGSRLRLTISEGPLTTVSAIQFTGNDHQTSEKLSEYLVGPTRERNARANRLLPFVAADLEEGADLVHRVYVAEGYLNSIVQAPHYRLNADRSQVEVFIAIVEGRQYLVWQHQFRRPGHLRSGKAPHRTGRCACPALHRGPARGRAAAAPGILQRARLLRCEGGCGG